LGLRADIFQRVALAQADVSIAQGGGSHAATATADFALISESLLSIITLQAIAKATYRRIISNFCWACVYNVVLIPLAAGAFYDLGRTKLPAVCKRIVLICRELGLIVLTLSHVCTSCRGFSCNGAVKRQRGHELLIASLHVPGAEGSEAFP
jgi:cation transport ATPase